MFRIKGWYGPAFFISTLPEETLDGPLNISVSFTAVVAGLSAHDVPLFSVLRWCAGTWIPSNYTRIHWHCSAIQTHKQGDIPEATITLLAECNDSIVVMMCIEQIEELVI